MLEIVNRFQLAAVVAGTFMSMWGLTAYGPCLWEILRGVYNHEKEFGRCAWNSCWAMVCISCFLLSFARANTIGAISLGQTVAGMFFIAGTTGFIAAIGMTFWATRARGKCKHFAPMKLSYIFATILIVIIAFAAVGFLHR